MLIRFHSQATMTAKIRAAIDAGDGAWRVPAERFGCHAADDLQGAKARQDPGSRPHAAPASGDTDACPGFGRGV